MTLEEAQKTLKKYSHLIGKSKPRETITHLAIMPMVGKHVKQIPEIVKCLLDERDYSKYWFGYDDFEVIVFYDLENERDIIFSYLDEYR